MAATTKAKTAKTTKAKTKTTKATKAAPKAEPKTTKAKATKTSDAKPTKAKKKPAPKAPKLVTIPGTKIKAAIGTIKDKRQSFSVHWSALEEARSGPFHDVETSKYIDLLVNNKLVHPGEDKPHKWSEDSNVLSAVEFGIFTDVKVTLNPETNGLVLTQGRKRRTWAMLAERILQESDPKAQVFVPCIFEENKDEVALQNKMILENVARVERTLMERIRDMHRWFEINGLDIKKKEDLSAAMRLFGKSKTSVKDYVRIAKADASVHRSLETDTISKGSAMEVLKGSPSKKVQRERLTTMLDEAGYEEAEINWFLDGDDAAPATETADAGDDAPPASKAPKPETKKKKIQANHHENVARAQTKNRILQFVQTCEGSTPVLEDQVRFALLWATGMIRDEQAAELIDGFDEIITDLSAEAPELTVREGDDYGLPKA